MIFHLGTQWLTFMAILQGSESVNVAYYVVQLCIRIVKNVHLSLQFF